MTGDRGRVPFALVGVLLLASAVGVVATTDPSGPGGAPALDRAMEGATAETNTALREAVQTAGRDAALDPVVEPANTTAGAALNDSRPFRDALRVRIYLAARERLEGVDRRRGPVRVSASLPALEDVEDVSRAKRRVHVERADADGRALRVRVENVTLVSYRDGRRVGDRTVSPTLVVPTPVLAMHDRVAAYQRQLDAGVTEAGLDRRLTARLYALAWARGYAQYGGLPIENVIDNRHVALATNAGLLDAQRATVGHADPTGRRTLAVATAKTGARDFLAASSVESPAVQAELDSPTRPVPDDVPGLDADPATGPETERRVGVNETADDAFRDLLENDTIEESIASVYGADVRLAATVDRGPVDRPEPPAAPGSNWTLANDTVDVGTGEVDVTAGPNAGTDRDGRSDGDGDRSAGGGSPVPPAAPDGWHRLAVVEGTVTVERVRVRTWTRGDRRRRTVSRTSERVDAAVAVLGSHRPGDRGPARPIDPVHERGGGPLDGPNLADVRERAVEEVVEGRGGERAVLARAATDRLDRGSVRVPSDRPAGVRSWIYRDLMDLRERVRAVAVTTERGRIGTFEANPPGALADAVRDRRSRLLDAPRAYDGAAERARVAARAAYLDLVIARLDDRAASRESRAGRFDDALSDRGLGSLASLRRGLRASRPTAPDRRATLTGPGGPVALRVDGAPSYLTLGRVDAERVPALNGTGHPLVARNVNVFSIPYGQVADALVGGAFGSSGRVRLAAAARTLRAANATLERADGPAAAGSGSDQPGVQGGVASDANRRGPDPRTLRDRRRSLAGEVRSANRHLRLSMRAELRKAGVGDDPSERRATVDSGLGRWDSLATKGLALSNGSAADAVARAAARRADLNETRRDRVRLRLRGRLDAERSRPPARPELAVVNDTRRTASDVATGYVEAALANASTRAVGSVANESFDAVPSGLPLAPPVGGWYATTNVWHVAVRGEYARFGVRADAGRPGAPGGELSYVRDGEAVRLDVDGDGDAERLGTANRVDFDVSTTLAVVVPPGKSGVGDRNGVANETSPGWPDPGPE